MTSRAHRILFTLSFITVAMLVAGIVVYRIVDAGIRESVDFKSARNTVGTVVAVKTFAATSPGAAGDSNTFCYTLDTLEQIPRKLRSKYEAAERQRERDSGYRCWVTNNPAAANLRAGDKLQVTYLLENNYVIVISDVKREGADLDGTSLSGKHASY